MSSPLPPRAPDWRTRLRRAFYAPITPGALRSVVFLFVLTTALSAANLFWTSAEVHRATATAASVVQLCQAANESRAQQVTLWTHLVAISQPPPHETAQGRAQRHRLIREFLAFVHRVFAPRNCTQKFSPGGTR